MSLVKDECVSTEQAIRVLQKAGYHIFKKEARLELHCQDQMEAGRYADYAKGDGQFAQYWARQTSQKLCDALLRSGAITISVQPPIRDDEGLYGYNSTLTAVRATLDFFPNFRREWQRT